MARGYIKAFARARRLVYLEDQYLWSFDATRALGAALRSQPELLVVVVLPRYPDPGGMIFGGASRFGREEVIRALTRAGGDRVAIYDLENEAGTPIYVHAKVCVVDDVWMTIGSDNFNRRSWTSDSELTCAVIDPERDPREPRDLSTDGSGARRLPRELRLQLWSEHLGIGADDEDGLAELIDPGTGFAAWQRIAGALDDWHAAGRQGPRPPGHARVHRPDPVGRLATLWAEPVYRAFFDPDARSLPARRANRF